ncbi:MAG: hypothetical protein V4472_26035 [Pseudomonadota bacterium]
MVDDGARYFPQAGIKIISDGWEYEFGPIVDNDSDILFILNEFGEISSTMTRCDRRLFDI